MTTSATRATIALPTHHVGSTHTSRGRIGVVGSANRNNYYQSHTGVARPSLAAQLMVDPPDHLMHMTQYPHSGASAHTPLTRSNTLVTYEEKE